jgi:hypothetical protein
MRNYYFHTEDREEQIAELLKMIKAISGGNAKIFGVREPCERIYQIYLLEPSEDFPVQLRGYLKRYDPKSDDNVSFRHTVGSARLDPLLIKMEGKNLERRISEAQLPVAEIVRWTFEFTNPKEQMMAPYHRLLREELDEWLEQKVQEGKVYV